jgi:hypothetical protein
VALTAGTRLGAYEILCPLGSGGMGKVYQAGDTRLARLVAIKVLPSHAVGDPHVRDRFEREALAIAALNHPHICTLFDIGDAAGLRFLVMEIRRRRHARRLRRTATRLRPDCRDRGAPVTWALLAETYLLRSKFDDARQAALAGPALAAETEERVWEAEFHRLRGQHARACGDPTSARAHFERATAVAREKGEKSLELRALISLTSSRVPAPTPAGPNRLAAT